METQIESMTDCIVGGDENGSGHEEGIVSGGIGIGGSISGSDIGDNTAGSASLRMSLRERPRKESITRNSKRFDHRSHFMDDFDPENSEREKRKTTKRPMGGSKYAPYDEYGHLRYNGADVCDCMNSDCPGCWYECEKCNSTKCGATCRVNRRFLYECMAFDGKDVTIMNPHLPQK